MAENNKPLSESLSSDILSSMGIDEDAKPSKAWSMSEIDNLLADDEEFSDDPYEFAHEYEEPDMDQITIGAVPEEPEPAEEPEAAAEEPVAVEEPSVEDVTETEEPANEAEPEAVKEPEVIEESDDETEEETIDEQEEITADEVRVSFMDRIRSIKDNFVNVVEGGEEEGEFSEGDVVDESDEQVEQETRKAAGFFRRRSASRGEHIETEVPQEEAPSVVMELADDEAGQLNRQALADKTVGLHPVYNDNIEHQIITKRVEKSNTQELDISGQLAAEEKTVHFIIPDALDAQPAEDLAKTRKIDKTSELEAIPQIIAADANLNTFDKAIVAKGDSKTIEHEQNREIDGQIKLDGFDDDLMLPEQVDEELTEEELREKRSQMVKDFKLNSTSESDSVIEEEEDFEDEYVFNEDLRRAIGDARYVRHEPDVTDYLNDEYENREEDAERIEDSLQRLVKSSLVTTISTAVIFVASLVFSIMLDASGNNLELFGMAIVTVAINAGLLLIAAILNVKTLVKGFKGLFAGRLNAAAATTTVVLAALLQDIVLGLVSTRSGTAVGLYTAAATFALLQSAIAKHLSYRRARANMELFQSGIQLYSSEVITNEEDAAVISRGLLVEKPVIAYNAKIVDVPNFVEDSFADDPADYNAERSTAIILIASLVLGIVFAIAKGPLAGFAIFVAVICMAIPAFATLASAMSLYLDDKKFAKTGSAIVGHKAVEQSAYVNTYALDSTDIFTKGSCQIIGIKTFHNMRIDDAILYAAALVIDSEGPLSDEFQNVILGKSDLLPNIDGLSYEEKLGLSAWIGERRILFGNRALMQGHSIDIPDEDFERQYTKNGRKAMYLAISGKVAAMFVIKYRANKRIRRYLQNMDRAGVTLLVRNTDCNITEEMISKYYRIPASAVKVLGPVAGEKVREYKNSETFGSISGIIHNGTLQTSVKTFYEARRLYDGVSINNILAIAFAVMAVILGVVLAVTSDGMIADFKIVIYQAVCALIATGLPILRSHRVK